jgi:excisionase family DNA binding protein
MSAKSGGDLPLSDALWTVEDVAEFLGVAPKTVRKWQLSGVLPFVKLGGKLVRFRSDAIRAWVDDHAVTASSADEGSSLVADLRRRLAQ